MMDDILIFYGKIAEREAGLVKKAEGFESQHMYVVPPYMADDMPEHPLLRQLYVTDIGYFLKALHHYRERPLGCSTYILIYCSSGEGTLSVDSSSYRIKERTLAMVPAHTPHVYQADHTNPWSIYWFHLQGEQVDEFAQSLQLNVSPINLGASEASKLMDLFQQIFDLLSTNLYSLQHWIHVSQSARYLFSYLSIMRGHSQDDKSQAHIERVIAFMRAHLEDNLSLDELAASTSLSKQHLHHLFKQSVGYAPVEYYLRLKMQRAVQLLDLTDRSIKDICLSLGFQDPYYFSRLFKKIMGLSPSAYRNQPKG
jgi:AraC-like DNA-binding protein